MAVALIVAAGRGERLGGKVPKAFVELAGRPLLDWSIDALAAVEEVERIVSSCYNQAVDLITTHRVTLDRIAQELRRQETIDAKQLKEIMWETGAVPVPAAATDKTPPQELAPPPPTETPLPPENR